MLFCVVLFLCRMGNTGNRCLSSSILLQYACRMSHLFVVLFCYLVVVQVVCCILLVIRECMLVCLN